jgi:hypothetical protein
MVTASVRLPKEMVEEIERLSKEEGFRVGHEMSAVSNAGPPIHLAKIGRLSLLKEIFEEIIVPRTVKVEVIDRGREKGKPDAFIIENAHSG